MNLAYLLRRAAAWYPDSPAVDDGIRQLTLAELLRRGESIANGLDLEGVGPHAPVGILSGNRAEMVQIDVALALGGRVRVALNSRLHLEDFRFVIEDAAVELLFYSPDNAEAALALAEQTGVRVVAIEDGDQEMSLDELAIRGGELPRERSIDAEDPAWITYTSGTTGRPKGIVLSHRAIREVAYNLLLELGPVVPGEQIVLTQAISHASGYFVLPYLLSGAGVNLMSRFDPDRIWQLSRREDLRTLKLVPAMLEPLLEAEAGEWGFETIVYGASSVSVPTLERSLERFGPTLFQDYGQSEAPMTITCLGKLDHLDQEARRSAGRPWRTVAAEVRGPDGAVVEVGEVGEVYVRAPQVMSGYHKNPAATNEVLVDDWLRTRDLAKVDERGFVYLQGRSDEIMNSGGYNIAPREVEDVLEKLPGVREVVVLGMPDPRWGDAVTAVIRQHDHQQMTPAEIVRYASERLGMRAPKRVEIWEDIPRTPYGKVDRVGVRKRLEGEATT
ncbi:MAG: AMP-binding protein [Actinobacteria bacterium]|nr:AMP-binding protein [Actinomycetota bacterium]